MEQKKPLSYSGSGVDIDAANRAKSRIKELVRSTYNDQVLSEIGLFGGLFQLQTGHDGPVLVSSADGVGTKLKIAFLTGIHTTVGADLVSHCVNDILVQGARPLFFLDYIATGKLQPEVVAQIVTGLVTGCREAGCVLIGGETAEMPDFYSAGEYYLAGFIVGQVARYRILDGSRIRPGDVVLGLPAAGLHTNGYSLARKIFFDHLGLSVDSYVADLECTVGEELLKPHLNYLPALQMSLDKGLINGLAHITGGGLLENIPRILPQGCSVEISRDGWEIPPVFSFMARAGQVEDMEMYRVFNMGIGMIAIVAEESQAPVQAAARAAGGHMLPIGRVVSGDGKVVIR